MIFRTTNMEAAVLELAKSNRLICVRTHRRVKLRSIRFRANSIVELPVHFYRPAVDGDGAIRRWQEAGGVLIDPSPRIDGLPPHDVHLFSECPLSVTLMEAQSRQAGKVIVYQPPSWEPQEAALERIFPTKEICRRVFDTLHKLAKAVLSERYEAIVKFTRLARWTVPVCTDTELAEYAQVDPFELSHVRDLVVRWPVTERSSARRIVGIATRFPPSDPALMEVWSKINERPDNYKGERFFDKHEIGKLGRNIQRTLSTLARTGSITKNPDVYVYALRNYEPDWWRINRTHETAVANFKEIRKMVKKAKEI